MGFIKSGLIGRRGGMTRATWGGRRIDPQEGQTLLFYLARVGCLLFVEEELWIERQRALEMGAFVKT